MQRLPVLVGLLRGMTARSIKRIMEDLNTAMPKVRRQTRLGTPHYSGCCLSKCADACRHDSALHDGT